MFPNLSFGPFGLPAYPSLIVAGLLLAWWGIYRRSLPFGWPTTGLVTVLLLSVPAGAVGARILASMVESLAGDGWAGFDAGMTVIGATAGLMVYAALVVPRWLGVETLEFLDAIAFSMPVSFIFGRAGCLALGCCHGSEAAPRAPAWLTIDVGSYAPGTVPRVLFDPLATEQIWNLPLLFIVQAAIVLVIVELHYRRTRAWAPAGATAALALFLDALGRTLIEPARGGSWEVTATPNPWATLASIYLGVAVLLLAAVWARWAWTRSQETESRGRA
jgi:prolipoprotein diacylglyceryltransferase